MALNPLAKEFVPSTSRTPASPYTGWGRDGRAPRAGGFSDFFHEPDGLGFADLPDEVVATVLGKLDDPADVLAAVLTCKRVEKISSEAPLRLRPRGMQLEAGRVQSLLSTVRSNITGVVELDLSGCSGVDDTVVIATLHALPKLRVVHLSSCRKLTLAFTRAALLKPLSPPINLTGNRGQWGIQALALQRCFQLDCTALSDILRAAAAPSSKLTTVTLSHLDLDSWPMDEASSNARHSKSVRTSEGLGRVPAAHSIPCTSLQMLALHNCKRLAPEGLAFLAACCPDLSMLLLGGSSLAVPLRDAKELADANAPGGGQHMGPQILWGVNSFAGYHSRVAAALVDAAQGILKLRILELTFFPPSVANQVAAALAGTGVNVWDLSRAASLEAAAEAQQGRGGAMVAKGAELSMALAAAANCSSASRHTPLHAAVDADCAWSVKTVLGLGGQLEARDQSGATPLFLACETGRLACVRTLLDAGAELCCRNAAGETPLYIAALRGHERVVEELLHFCDARNIAWTASHLYGDGWNPLMAAAVADRHAIALRLLQAAGPQAASLARATNRYGQTAAHIAARKGSRPLLLALLNAAGSSLAMVRDNDNKSPTEIAQHYRHDDAVRLLRSSQASAVEAQYLPRASQGQAHLAEGCRGTSRRRWNARSGKQSM